MPGFQRVYRRSAGAIALAFAASVPAPLAAQTGIGFSITPGIDYVRWNQAFGLEDTYLYGGKLGLLLGPRISLQPYLFLRDGIEADPSTIGDGTSAFGNLGARSIDVRHVGADVQISLGDYGIVPFVRGGGGVLRIQPDGLDRSDQITLKAGGGVRLQPTPTLRMELFAEDWGFRLDRASLYAPAGGGASPADDEADEWRHNLVVGGGVTFALGGGSGDPDWNPGGGGVSVVPFVGRMNYASDLDLGHQNVAGVRAGIDFNTYFGLRGFYWRAINDDFDGTDPLRAYGGEAQFSLGSGTGLSPFLTAGAGRLDFDTGFEQPAGTPREDRTALILGGGLALNLSNNFQIEIAARDYLFDRNAMLEDVSDPGDLTSNLLYSAGLSFRVGGSRTQMAAAQGAPRPEDRRAADASTARERELAARERDLAVREAALERQTREVDQPDEVERLRRRNEIEMLRLEGERLSRLREQLLRQDLLGETRSGVRADGDDAISRAELREAIRQAIREEMAVQRGTHEPAMSVSDRDLSVMERRIEQYVDSMVQHRMRTGGDTMRMRTPQRPSASLDPALEARLDRLERRMDDRIDAMVDARVEAASATRSGNDQLEAEPRQTGRDAPQLVRPSWRLQQFRPYGGVAVNGGGQFILGGRFDLGPVTPNSPFDLVPEIAFGLGGGNTTVLVAANLQYPIATLGERYAITPFVEAGGGVFSETVFSLNTGYGASFLIRPGSSALHAYVEHQGINLFDRNRLLFGLRLER